MWTRIEAFFAPLPLKDCDEIPVLKGLHASILVEGTNGQGLKIVMTKNMPTLLSFDHAICTFWDEQCIARPGNVQGKGLLNWQSAVHPPDRGGT